MHSATLSSERLQKVYNLLLTGPKTTMEIVQQAGVCAVNSIAAELRANGIPVQCTMLGKGRFQYRLEKLF